MSKEKFDGIWCDRRYPELLNSTITLPDPACHLFLTRTLDRTAVAELLVHFAAAPDPDDCHVLVIGEQAPDMCCLALLERQGLAHVFHGDHIAMLLEQIAQRRRRAAEIEVLLQTPLVREHLPGDSAVWRQTLRQAILAARHGGTAPVLLLGETGTGKEMLARLIHTLDSRPQRGDLITVDCTTLTPELAGTELFGHERGAFTGAVGARRGVTAAADGGTLFLDEVGELCPEVQARLLRVLQEGTFKPVGGNDWQKVSFRLVCATHRCLLDEVREGRFRADLYYRIASTVVQVPRLAARGADVLLLARRFLREFGASGEVDPLVSSLLQQHRFDGNVRELRHLMQQAVMVIGTGSLSPLTLDALPGWWRTDVLTADTAADLADASANADATGVSQTSTALAEQLVRQWIDTGLGYEDISQRACGIAIRVAMADCEQNITRAAQRLQITPRTIHKRREKGLPV